MREIRDLDQQGGGCRTIPVPEAGRRYFGLGRNASYEAAKRGEIPVIRIGRQIRAVVARLEEMVGNHKELQHD